MASKRVGSVKNANYDYNKQVAPEHRMGTGSYANLPEQAIMRPFAGPKYRSGVPNSFSCTVSDVSGIDENER
jgi:hypothetical protein